MLHPVAATIARPSGPWAKPVAATIIRSAVPSPHPMHEPAPPT